MGIEHYERHPKQPPAKLPIGEGSSTVPVRESDLPRSLQVKRHIPNLNFHQRRKANLNNLTLGFRWTNSFGTVSHQCFNDKGLSPSAGGDRNYKAQAQGPHVLCAPTFGSVQSRQFGMCTSKHMEIGEDPKRGGAYLGLGFRMFTLGTNRVSDRMPRVRLPRHLPLLDLLPLKNL